MKKLLKILLPILALCIVIALGVHHYFSQKIYYNDSYVDGNYSGNLYNGGYFCEKDGIIYFSNTNDKGHLYSISRTGNDLARLSDDTARYINVDDHYIFYTCNNEGSDGEFSFFNMHRCALVRIKHNGSDKAILDDAPSMYACQIGNKIYYVHYDTKHASTLYCVGIDGKDQKMLRSMPIIAVCSDGEYLYFAGNGMDHNLYRVDAKDDSIVSIQEGAFYNPIIIKDHVYYMDCDHNYALTKMNLETGETFVITDERVDCFNVYGNYVYFQKNSETSPALMRIKTDGTEEEQIVSGNYANINVTSSYVYFSRYDDPSTFFYTPTTGKIVVNVFNPGIIEED